MVTLVKKRQNTCDLLQIPLLTCDIAVRNARILRTYYFSQFPLLKLKGLIATYFFSAAGKKGERVIMQKGGLIG